MLSGFFDDYMHKRSIPSKYCYGQHYLVAIHVQWKKVGILGQYTPHYSELKQNCISSYSSFLTSHSRFHSPDADFCLSMRAWSTFSLSAFHSTYSLLSLPVMFIDISILLLGGPPLPRSWKILFQRFNNVKGL